MPGLGNRPDIGDRPDIGNRPSQLPSRTPQERRDGLQDRLSSRQDFREGSREDWQEIANVVKRNTGAIGQELSRFGRDLEQQQRELTDITELSAERPANVVPIEQKAAVVEEEAEELDVLPEPVANGNGDGESAEPEEEKPWYVPERAVRRRSPE